MEKVPTLRSRIRHATNKWMLDTAQKRRVCGKTVIPIASSHSLYNCNLVRSPEPNQITKLNLPSTSYGRDLGSLGGHSPNGF